MDGLILAAGMATRLRPLTQNRPKCLLNLHNRPILQYIIDNLFDNNIEKIIIVTGFLEEMVKEFIKSNYDLNNFIFITNKDYADTNNAYSLLLARDKIEKGFVLLDSDIIFDKRIISHITKEIKGVMLAIKRHNLAEEEIKVIMDKDGEIKKIGKEVPVEKAYGESIGIEYFPYEHIGALFDTLERRIIKEKRYNEFYEAAFQDMIEQGHKFYGVDIEELEAIEIDFKEDLEKAEQIVKNIF